MSKLDREIRRIEQAEEYQRQVAEERRSRGLDELDKHRSVLLDIDNTDAPVRAALTGALLYVLDELEKLK